MIEVFIFGALSDYWIVEYHGTMYLLRDEDIVFIGGREYTYPDKLRQTYNKVR